MSNGNSNHSIVDQILHFEEFITVRFIRVVFIVGFAFGILSAMVSCIVLAFSAYHMMNGQDASAAMGILTFLGGSLATFIIMIAGLVFWRMFCELVVVVFKINDNLQYLRDHGPMDPNHPL